jgi:hypothetical protein
MNEVAYTTAQRTIAATEVGRLIGHVAPAEFHPVRANVASIRTDEGAARVFHETRMRRAPDPEIGQACNVLVMNAAFSSV